VGGVNVIDRRSVKAKTAHWSVFYSIVVAAVMPGYPLSSSHYR